MEVHEVQISVPWGHLSCRTWGDEKCLPVLLIHDLDDNAGSFDRIIPLLPTDTYFYISVDLPGHGQSSHWPQASVYHAIDFLMSIRLVLKHFAKGKKVVLIGHGLGATLAFICRQMFPEIVEKLVLIDNIFEHKISSTNFKRYTIEHHDAYFKNDTSEKVEYTTYEELLREFMAERKQLTKNAAENLLKRGAREISVGNTKKYLLSNDGRLKNVFHITYDVDFILDLLKKSPIMCPVLVVISRKRMPNAWLQEKRFLKLLKRQSNVKVLYLLDKGHDVHQNDPQLMGKYIGEFLDLKKSKM